MSEKNLIVRKKFISKIYDKINDLNQSIDLLNNVDRKLIQQNGGNPLKDLQVAVEMVNRKGPEFAELNTKITTMKSQVTTLMQNLQQLTDKLNRYNDGLVVPKIDDLQEIGVLSDADLATAVSAAVAAKQPPSASRAPSLNAAAPLSRAASLSGKP